MKALITRTTIMTASAVASMLLVFLTGRDAAFTSVTVTALAALTLMLSLPLVDSALAGGGVPAQPAGLCAGLAVGFFMRQAEVSPDLAHGADRILAVALLVSIALIGRRLWMRRRFQRA